MNITDSETDRPSPNYNHAQTFAAALIVVTNLALPSLVFEPAPHAYAYEWATSANPLTTATTPVATSRNLESYTATTAIEALVPRWNRYVAQRLEELEYGKFDFTGLLVPTRNVIERAWSVAQNYFRIDTPTPSVLPSEDGDVFFVWHKAGWDLRIDVGPEGTVAWAHDGRTGTEWFGLLEEQRMQLSGLLDILGRS